MERWEVILHFMVGSPSAAVSQDLAQLLVQAGLMKRYTAAIVVCFYTVEWPAQMISLSWSLIYEIYWANNSYFSASYQSVNCSCRHFPLRYLLTSFLNTKIWNYQYQQWDAGHQGLLKERCRASSVTVLQESYLKDPWVFCLLHRFFSNYEISYDISVGLRNSVSVTLWS